MINPEFLPRDLIPYGNRKGEPNSVIINPNAGRRTVDYREFEDVPKFMEANLYITPRQLEDGSWCAIYNLAFTTAVLTDITPTSFAYRWCFKDPKEAEKFLAELVNFDDIPTSHESLTGHRFDSQARMIKFDDKGYRRW